MIDWLSLPNAINIQHQSFDNNHTHRRVGPRIRSDPLPFMNSSYNHTYIFIFVHIFLLFLGFKRTSPPPGLSCGLTDSQTQIHIPLYIPTPPYQLTPRPCINHPDPNLTLLPTVSVTVQLTLPTGSLQLLITQVSQHPVVYLVRNLDLFQAFHTIYVCTSSLPTRILIPEVWWVGSA